MCYTSSPTWESIDSARKFLSDQGHGFYIIHDRGVEIVADKTKWNIRVKQGYDTCFNVYILLILCIPIYVKQNVQLV